VCGAEGVPAAAAVLTAACHHRHLNAPPLPQSACQSSHPHATLAPHHTARNAKQIIQGSGTAMLGVGYGSGPDRAEEAAFNAINTPLINNNVIEVSLGGGVCVSGSGWRAGAPKPPGGPDTPRSGVPCS
jgi:hypothetical protein